MTKHSRRQLAKYAVDELVAGRGGQALARELASALILSGRGKQAELLVKDVYQELEDCGLTARAMVSTSRPLNEKQKRKIVKYIKELARVESVSIENEVDQSLLGGIKIQTATHQWDSTLRRQLRALKEAV